MTDPRPRPQYGEYATPEDQAKAMGLGAPKPDISGTDAAASVSPSGAVSAPLPAYGANGSAPTTSNGAQTYGTGQAPVAPTAAPTSTAIAPPARRVPARRTWDVVLTAALLGLGVASLLSSYSQYADFATTINAAFSQLGYGALTATELAGAVGVGLNVTQVVLLVASGAVSMLLLRRGRLSFYVPLVGAVVFALVMVILLAILLANDPSMLATVSG